MVALQSLIGKHLQHQKHTTGDILLEPRSISGSRSIGKPSAPRLPSPNIRVPLGPLHLPALSHVRCLQVSNFTILLLRYFLKFLVVVVHSATTVLPLVSRRNYVCTEILLLSLVKFKLSDLRSNPTTKKCGKTVLRTVHVSMAQPQTLTYKFFKTFVSSYCFTLLENCATFGNALRTLDSQLMKPTRVLFARHQRLGGASRKDDESFVQFSGRLK